MLQPEVVGIELATVGPLQSQYLRLERGLTVLYGRNGSGKSTLLSAIQKGEIILRWPPNADAGAYCSPWRAGVHPPQVAWDEFSVPYHRMWSTQLFSIRDLVSNYRDMDDVASRFAAVGELWDGPELAYDHVLDHLWEMVVHAVMPGWVADEWVDDIVAALGEIVHQGLFSFRYEPATLSFGEYWRITHRVILDASSPACSRIARAGAQAITAANGDEAYEVLRHSGLGGLLHEASDLLAEEESGSPPFWAGYPTYRFPSTLLPPVQLVTESDDDLDALTIQRIETGTFNYRWHDANGEAIVLKSAFDAQGGADPNLDTLLSHLTEAANDLYKLFLEDAPELMLVVVPQGRWDVDGKLRWVGIDPSGAAVPVCGLSSAQQRWARFAIQMALAQFSGAPILLLLDEPERALHRRAERQLLLALQRLAEERAAWVVVATHSPAFLRQDLGTLVHVDRGPDGTVNAEPMGADLRERLNELGIDPADLLQLCRTIVLVEGEHDRLVLEELFGDEFSAAGVRVLPIRGAKQLKSVVDAQLLFDYTDARLVVLYDNDEPTRIEKLWHEAQAQYDSQGNWLEVLSKMESPAGGEGRYLKEFCSRALTHSMRHRLSIRALSAPDILDYLPVAAFVTSVELERVGATSWADLRQLHDRSVERDFKRWLQSSVGAEFSKDRVLGAVEQLDEIPSDLADFLDFIRSAQSWPT